MTPADPELDAGIQAAGIPAAAVGAGARSEQGFRPALVWSYVLTTGGSLVGAALQVGLVAILDPRSFGVMVLALLWVTLSIMLLTHGPSLAVIQQDGIDDDHINAAFWITTAGTVGYVIAVAAFAPLWAKLNHLPELTTVCWALLPCILLTGLTVVPDAVMRRRLQMRAIAARGLSSTLLGGLAGVGCAFAGLGVWSLVVQQLVAAAVFTVLLARATPWWPSRPDLGRIRRAWPDISRSSVQSLSGSLGNFVASRVDALLMGLFFTPVLIGLYRFAARFAEMAIDLTSRGLEQVALPELARYKADPAVLAERLGRMMHLGSVLAIPSLAVLAVAAHPFMLVFGGEWGPAATLMPALCAVSAVSVVANLLGPALQAVDRAEIPAAFTWISAAVYVAGFLITVAVTGSMNPMHRLVTVVAVLLVLRIAVTILMAYVTYRVVLRVSGRPMVRAAVPSVLAALAAVAVGSVVHRALGNAVPPIVGLIIVGGAATLAAGATLLAIDAQVRGWARRAHRALGRRSVAG